MTQQPGNESELQLYRVLQRANLLAYYDTFIGQGGDDVQQLCEAGEEEFLEIMALVGMASKPLHVRRLQKALQEWVSNPAMFQVPLVPQALPPSHATNHHMTGAGSSMNRGGSSMGGQMPPSMRPSPPMAPGGMLTNHSSPSPHAGGGSQGSKDVVPSSPSSSHQLQQQHQLHHHQHHLQHQQHHQSQMSTQQQQQQQQVAQQQQQAAAAAVAAAHSQLQQMYSQNLPPYVMNIPEDDPRRMEEIRKYAAIYGRFDCKRKAEKPLTQHEAFVNEAAAQLCKQIPSLLTRRDEHFPLARQVVRESGYQYSKGHSRSQMYNKMEEEQQQCKRLRMDASPGQASDKPQMEEERKKRQERLDSVSEQLKMLGEQQEELKKRLQQAREIQNFSAVTHLQTQLEQISAQQMQLINEQSELNRQIRRIDRYYMGGKGCGRLSSCSDPDKMDNDDTDSQFSVYSNASSPTLSHEAHDSPSQDSSQSGHNNNNGAAADVFGTMKMVKKTSAQITKQLVQETLIDEGLRVVKELEKQIKEESEVAAAMQQQQQQSNSNSSNSPPRNITSSNSNALNSHHQSHQQQSTGGSNNSSSLSPPKPDGPRPRGRPPRLDRGDYGGTVSTSTAMGSCSSRATTPMGHPPPATTPSPSCANHNNGGSSSVVAPSLSPSAQNGRSPGPILNGPCASSTPSLGDSLNGPAVVTTPNGGVGNTSVSASSSSSEGFAMPLTNGTASLNNHHPHHHSHHQHAHHMHQHGGGAHSPVIDISSPGDAGNGMDMVGMGTKGGSSNSLNALLAFSQKGIKQEPSSPSNAYKID